MNIEKLNKTEFSPTQLKLVEKIEVKPFEIQKKSTYEPLYNLLKSLFVTEFPNFKNSKVIAQIFFENEVTFKQSAYKDYRSYGLLFHSFFSNNEVKKQVFNIITENVEPVILQKRINRCKDETLLNSCLEEYNKLQNSQKYEQVFQKGFIVIIAALQILAYLPDNKQQIEKINQLIEEIINRLKSITSTI
jgi:hypothetical protein